VRTVIAPLDAEVSAQLQAPDDRLRDVCGRYLRRLALEPLLGHPLDRGELASRRARAIYVDHGDHPEELLTGRSQGTRRGDQDPSEGPRWRIVYVVRETRDRRLRMIVVLGVGLAHPDSGHESIYTTAARTARRLIKETNR
jgi:hypothetical protein